MQSIINPSKQYEHSTLYSNTSGTFRCRHFSRVHDLNCSAPARLQRHQWLIWGICTAWLMHSDSCALTLEVLHFSCTNLSMSLKSDSCWQTVRVFTTMGRAKCASGRNRERAAWISCGRRRRSPERLHMRHQQKCSSACVCSLCKHVRSSARVFMHKHFQWVDTCQRFPGSPETKWNILYATNMSKNYHIFIKCLSTCVLTNHYQSLSCEVK